MLKEIMWSENQEKGKNANFAKYGCQKLVAMETSFCLFVFVFPVFFFFLQYP